MTEENRNSLIRIKHILSEISMFEDFTPEELDFFSKTMSLRFVPEQTLLFRGGDIGDYLFFIVNGMVEVRLESVDLKQIIIASFGPGCSVGEMSIIDDYTRSATIVVTQPSELLILSRKRLNSICEECPGVGLKLLRGLAKNLSSRLRKTNGRFADLA
ncbi:MAG: cyclic nucleotide-binding domain-containing protein [Desulfobulbaceae bacterium]|nr:cyclic nucleotide-binding domain-containing protein [Desulfobulbaceae bacterium]